jgi:PTS system mannose-specific IIB component/fructoselysine and glucoselysine-specific PTS system IIB component
MPALLFRVDERLIHGQVVVGWGSVLRPDLIVVVDDELADSPWEQELYTLGLPREIEAAFCSVEGARAAYAGWCGGARRVVVLTRDLRTMRRLAAGGLLRGEEINLGGVHYGPGRRAILPYLFLNAEEEEDLRQLASEGVSISARDLPGSRRVELSELLGKHEVR